MESKIDRLLAVQVAKESYLEIDITFLRLNLESVNLFVGIERESYGEAVK